MILNRMFTLYQSVRLQHPAAQTHRYLFTTPIFSNKSSVKVTSEKSDQTENSQLSGYFAEKPYSAMSPAEKGKQAELHIINLILILCVKLWKVQRILSMG